MTIKLVFNDKISFQGNNADLFQIFYKDITFHVIFNSSVIVQCFLVQGSIT